MIRLAMRILLTGATGYIGAAVLDALVRAGHDVTALVRDNSKAARMGGSSSGKENATIDLSHQSQKGGGKGGQTKDVKGPRR